MYVWLNDTGGVIGKACVLKFVCLSVSGMKMDWTAVGRRECSIVVCERWISSFCLGSWCSLSRNHHPMTYVCATSSSVYMDLSP